MVGWIEEIRNFISFLFSFIILLYCIVSYRNELCTSTFHIVLRCIVFVFFSFFFMGDFCVGTVLCQFAVSKSVIREIIFDNKCFTAARVIIYTTRSLFRFVLFLFLLFYKEQLGAKITEKGEISWCSRKTQILHTYVSFWWI